MCFLNLAKHGGMIYHRLQHFPSCFINYSHCPLSKLNALKIQAVLESRACIIEHLFLCWFCWIRCRAWKERIVVIAFNLFAWRMCGTLNRLTTRFSRAMAQCLLMRSSVTFLVCNLQHSNKLLWFWHCCNDQSLGGAGTRTGMNGRSAAFWCARGWLGGKQSESLVGRTLSRHEACSCSALSPYLLMHNQSTSKVLASSLRFQ